MGYSLSLYDINGQTISVREEGQAHRQVAILIHGWASSWHAVAPLLPPLSQRYRCLAVNLPGYGKFTLKKKINKSSAAFRRAAYPPGAFPQLQYAS